MNTIIYLQLIPLQSSLANCPNKNQLLNSQGLSASGLAPWKGTKTKDYAETGPQSNSETKRRTGEKHKVVFANPSLNCQLALILFLQSQIKYNAMDLFIRNLIDSAKVNLTVKQCLVLFSKDFNTIPSLRDKVELRSIAISILTGPAKLAALHLR